MSGSTTEKQVYSVKQINSYIKQLFDGDFILRSINIKGEISNCKYHHSGHIYFSLKDDTSVISCVMFASNTGSLKIKLEDGKQVIVSGSIGVYEAAGRYQIYARQITEEGEGDLYKKYEELKKKLEEEGLFSQEHKKDIPPYSSKIGVVTAETGAVIKDIFNVSTRRNPYVQIFLYPATVQGEGAKETIVRGIKKLDEMGLDVIIVGRGGGSIEDLWAFNEEEVVRAIYECNTPIISAIGHETDYTLSDFSSDMRAPTPSAAAELAVFDFALFERQINDYRYSFGLYIENKLKRRADAIDKYRLMIEKLSPEKQVIQKRQRLLDIESMLKDLMNEGLDNASEKLAEDKRSVIELMEEKMRNRKQTLVLVSEKLNGLSPLKRLSEGYAYVTKDNKKLSSIRQIKLEDEIDINIADGRLKARVNDIKEVKYE